MTDDITNPVVVTKFCNVIQIQLLLLLQNCQRLFLYGDRIKKKTPKKRYVVKLVCKIKKKRECGLLTHTHKNIFTYPFPCLCVCVCAVTVQDKTKTNLCVFFTFLLGFGLLLCVYSNKSCSSVIQSLYLYLYTHHWMFEPQWLVPSHTKHPLPYFVLSCSVLSCNG